MITRDSIQATIDYIYRDYQSWPLRFALEVMAWVMSIGAAVLFALTVPTVPFLIYLTIVITGSTIYTWAAWTRGSFGMLINYFLLTLIDTVALIRFFQS